MSGYLSRLMDQTGMVVPGSGTPVSQAPVGAELSGRQSATSRLRVIEADTARPAGIEEEPLADAIQAQAPVDPPGGSGDSGPHVAAQLTNRTDSGSGPVGQPDVRHIERSAEEPDDLIGHHEREEVVPPFATRKTVDSAGEDRVVRLEEIGDSDSGRSAEKVVGQPGSPIVEVEAFDVAADPLVAHAAPRSAGEPMQTSRDILTTVRSWMALPASGTEDQLTVGVAGSPRTTAVRNQDARAGSALSAGTDTLADAATPVQELSLSIGTISVTIEGSAPVETPRPPPARMESSQGTGDSDRLRFRRHYLRG